MYVEQFINNLVSPFKALRSYLFSETIELLHKYCSHVNSCW